jgi:hypothetical protein
VRPGQSIETGDGATVEVRYPDGTRLTVGEASELSLQANREKKDPAKRYFLRFGEVAGGVTPQPDGAPLRVTSVEGIARVEGTRFRITAGSGRTRLEVTRGRVRLTRRSDGKYVSVSAGEYAVAAAGVELAVKPLRAPVQPVQPKPPEMAVVSLTLIYSETGKTVPGFDPIQDGAVLDLNSLSSRKLNVRANVRGSPGSVTFWFDDKLLYTENGAPFMLAGDSSGPGGRTYGSWTPPPGAHTLRVTPFSEPVEGHSRPGGGEAGKSHEVRFEVVEK